MASLVSAVSAPAYETRKRSNSTMPPPRLDAPATRAPFPSPTTPSRTSATAPQTTPTPAIAPASHLLHGGPDMPREFPPPGCVHRIAPEDARDKILMGICAALAHVENRALTPRQIVDVVHQAGIIKLGGNTPASTVSTHIRAHLARATSPLLLRHSLLPRPRRPETPTIEDCAVGPSPDGSSERKKGTAWYLSEAAGFASPWDRLGIPTPNEPESDNRPSPSPAPVPLPMESIDSQPQRVSSRKRTRTKSWSAAARELGMDGMTPAPEYDDESEAEAHRERKSKVRIRLRLGSLSTASRSSSVRPDDPPLLNPVEDDSDSEPPSNPSPTRNRVFSAPCPHLSRRSLSNSSSGGPSTPHALVFVDEDSDVEDGDFHVRMMCNSDSAPSSPRKPADQAPIVGIGLGLIFEGSDRGVKVKEESESSMSPPSLSSRASSLAASSLPEDDVWAVKIEEVEDVKMVVDLPPFEPPELCEVPLGFDIGTTYEGFEAEFAMLGVRSPTIIPHAFIREPDHVDGPESMRLDEVDRLWSDWGSGADKRAHTRTPRAARTSPLKRRDPAWTWGCRGAPGMRVSLNGARSRVCREGTPTGVVMQRERELTIERIVLHGIAYASCVIRGCVLLRRLEDAYVSLSSLLRACRVPGSCHAQFRTSGTVDVSIPPSDNDVSDAAEPTATETATQAPKPQPTRNPSPSRTAPEPSDVLHTHNSSSDMVHPGTMPQGASIDFGTGVEAADVSGMWCPLAEARAVAEERLRPYLPEDIRLVFLGDGLEIKQPEPEPMEETKAELEETPSEPEANEPDADEPEMKTDADAESKTDADAESKIEADEPEQRDDTPSAPAPAREKVLAASDEDVSIFVRPSSPATVPCAARRVLRARPARVARTRTRA